MANALLDLPKEVKKGEAFLVKIVLAHVMETGYRRDISGRPIPRNIIRTLRARYDGAEVFRADLTQAIAANPFFAFPVLATVSGPLTLEWVDDEGVRLEETAQIRVAG